MNERNGDWIETYTGVQFYPLDPRPQEIKLEDIAHALSLICRFTGHTKYFYSVAQHSINCALYARNMSYSPSVQMLLLLHDASEAYICDVARPIKPFLKNYMEIEERLQNAIYMRFGLNPKEVPDSTWELMHTIDTHMLHFEAKLLLSKATWALKPLGNFNTDKYCIDEMIPRTIESAFLSDFKLLAKESGIMEV